MGESLVSQTDSPILVACPPGGLQLVFDVCKRPVSWVGLLKKIAFNGQGRKKSVYTAPLACLKNDCLK